MAGGWAFGVGNRSNKAQVDQNSFFVLRYLQQPAAMMGMCLFSQPFPVMEVTKWHSGRRKKLTLRKCRR
jgi:hypothetical protein